PLFTIYEEGSTAVFYDKWTAEKVVALGAGSTMLLKATGFTVWKAGVDTPVTFPEPDGGTLGGAEARFVDGKFLVVRGGFKGSLFTVDLDGTVTKVGDYQPGPYSASGTPAIYGDTLDKAGNLYAIIEKNPREVLRFSLSAAPQVIHVDRTTVCFDCVRMVPTLPGLLSGGGGGAY